MGRQHPLSHLEVSAGSPCLVENAFYKVLKERFCPLSPAKIGSSETPFLIFQIF